MKKIMLTTVLILTICITSMGNRVVASGQSNSAFGNYKIEQLDDHLMLKKQRIG